MFVVDVLGLLRLPKESMTSTGYLREEHILYFGLVSSCFPPLEGKCFLLSTTFTTANYSDPAEATKLPN